ncbi:MAG: hypothetical protein ACXVBE_01195 [Bdellovibrionota bacterium]
MFRKIIILALLLSPSSFALASKDRGGGDEIGLEFVSSLKAALQEIQEKSPSLYKKLEPLDLAAAAESAKVIVTDENLVAESEKVEQSSVAINEPAKNLIVINRARWKLLMSENLKRAIALHEVLSLKHLENTGVYPLSAEYLTLSGVELRGLKANTGKISQTLLDAIVRVPDAVLIPASSITVEGNVNFYQQSDNTLYVLKLRRDSKGQLLRGPGNQSDVRETTEYKSVGEEIILPAGEYRLALSGSVYFTKLAVGEKKVIHLANLTVPKVDGNYKVAVFADFTDTAEFDKKLLMDWTDGYPIQNYGFENNVEMLNVHDVCTHNYDRGLFGQAPKTFPFGPRQSRACHAWLSGDYRQLLGNAIRANKNGSWARVEFNATVIFGSVMPNDDSKVWTEQGRQMVSSDDMHDGDSISVFPGTYAIEFTNIAGQKNIEYGIKVK